MTSFITSVFSGLLLQIFFVKPRPEFLESASEALAHVSPGHAQAGRDLPVGIAPVEVMPEDRSVGLAQAVEAPLDEKGVDPRLLQVQGQIKLACVR